MIRWLAALALAVTSLVMFGTAPAHACSCKGGTPQEYAGRASAVFRGTIVHTDPGSMTAMLVYEVEVDAVFKGEVSRSALVSTSAVDASCGLPDLPEGEPLIFFASGSADTFSVDSCDGTASGPPVTLKAVTALLGKPYEPSGVSAHQASPEGANGGAGDGADLAPWLAAAGLLVAAAVGGGGFLRRRRGA